MHNVPMETLRWQVIEVLQMVVGLGQHTSDNEEEDQLAVYLVQMLDMVSARR